MSDDIRASIRNILSGGDGTVPDDPFAQPNEWEDSKRRERKEKQQRPEKPHADPNKPKSRRAQQAQAKAAAAAAKQAATAEHSNSKASRGKQSWSDAPAAPTVAPASRVLLPAVATWWEALDDPPDGGLPPNESQAVSLRLLASNAYEAEVGAFALSQRRAHGADHRIVQRLTAAGTVKDRVAALTVQAQESSFHCLPHLRSLLSLAERPRPEVKLAATDALCDLFLQRLLPPDRQLYSFERRSFPPNAYNRGGDGSGSGDHLPNDTLSFLLQAHYEAELKELYAKVVTLVEAGSRDSLMHIKQKMIGQLYAMLSARPEQERRLLASLINKLGDPEKKVASRLAYLLNQLTVHHPAMKAVILAEIQKFVLRSNVSEASQYYSAVCMNQMILTRSEPQIAHTLVLIYLSLFAARASAEGGKPLGSRMLSCILSGIHRAIPFCDHASTREQTGEVLTSQLTSLFRCAHAASFSTAVQALMVLSHAAGFAPSTNDRFHRALYAAIHHPDLPTSAKQALFLNVVYKSMKSDTNEPRVCAFAKRCLQACAHAPPSFVCGVLLLLSEVMKRQPVLKGMLSKLVIPKPVDLPPKAPPDVSGEEPSSSAAAAEEKEKEEDDDEEEEEQAAVTDFVNPYDWSKRDPSHCGAETQQLWELQLLMIHYHPSVVQFAKSLVKGEPISYAGDPLRDFGLMPFLDKFVFKNPKSAKRRQAGGSIMQPAQSEASTKMGLSQKSEIAKLLDRPIERVDAHEQFFHTYFKGKKEAEARLQKKGKQKAAAKEAKKKKEKGDDSDDSDDEDEEDGGDDLGKEGEAFATRLAKSIMRDGLDDDDDEDDDGFEGEDSDDEDDEGDEAFDFGEEGEEGDEEEDELDEDGLPGEDVAMDQDDDEEEEADSAKKKGKRKKKEKGPMFADASEFAHILEAAADEDEGVNKRLAEWEGGVRKKHKRKADGGGGGSSSGGGGKKRRR